MTLTRQNEDYAAEEAACLRGSRGPWRYAQPGSGTGPMEDEMDTGTNGPHPEWCSCPHCREGTSTGDVPDPSQTEPDWSRKCIVCGASPVMPITEMCGPCTFGEAETAGGNW